MTWVATGRCTARKVIGDVNNTEEYGTEIEKRGIEGPMIYQSCYIRFWIGKRIFILDSREGIKKGQKNKNKFKMIFGISSL